MNTTMEYRMDSFTPTSLLCSQTVFMSSQDHCLLLSLSVSITLPFLLPRFCISIDVCRTRSLSSFTLNCSVQVHYLGFFPISKVIAPHFLPLYTFFPTPFFAFPFLATVQINVGYPKLSMITLLFSSRNARKYCKNVIMVNTKFLLF